MNTAPLRHWSFRTRLTFRWTLAFGLILALAQVAIYVGARYWSHAELDAQVRTLATLRWRIMSSK